MHQIFFWFESAASDNIRHGLRTPREEIAFTARPKIQSQSQIFRYGRSIFCLPHQPNFSHIVDLCLHWVSVVRGLYQAQLFWDFQKLVHKLQNLQFSPNSNKVLAIINFWKAIRTHNFDKMHFVRRLFEIIGTTKCKKILLVKFMKKSWEWFFRLNSWLYYT